MPRSRSIGKTCLAALLLVAAGGCSSVSQQWQALSPDDDDLRSRGWTEADDDVATEPEVYCYVTAAEPVCYEEQLIGQRHRLIDKDAPAPEPARRIATGQRSPAGNVRQLPDAEQERGATSPGAVESRPIEEPAEPAAAGDTATGSNEATPAEQAEASLTAMEGAVAALPEDADYTLRPDGTLVIPAAAYFPSARAELDETGQQRVATLGNALAEAMAELPDSSAWRLRVGGHTDRRPIDTDRFPSNQALSEARAGNVADLLAQQGIDRGRLVATGYGAQQPLTAGDTAAGQRLNRRLELALVIPGEAADVAASDS